MKLLACGMMVLAMAAEGRADTLYKSADMGNLNTTGGISLLSTQYLGAEFSLNSGAQVTAIGGNIGGDQPGTLFGAILKLPAGATMPSGNPFSNLDVMASVTFTPPAVTNGDIRVPLNVFLPAGNYELVFGSGLFGANGTGYMPWNNPAPAVAANTAAWSPDTGHWQEQGAPELVYMRFVVEGTAVPEPGTLGVACIGVLALFRRQRKG